MKSAVVAAFVMIIIASSPAVADPTAKELYADGQAAFDAEHYDAAIEAWEKSYAESQMSALLFDLGQAYRLRGAPGDCARASAAYKEFLARVAASPQRVAAERFEDETARCDAREHLAPPPPPPPRSAPQLVTHQAAPTPAPPSHRLARTSAIAIGAIGVIGLGAGIYYGHRASTIAGELSLACAAGCSWSAIRDDDAEGRTAERRQWIFVGAGAAAVVTSAALLWISHGDPERPAALAIAPRADGAIATWSFAW